MTSFPDEACELCGLIIVYSEGYYTIGPLHISCHKDGKPDQWVLDNCRMPEPWIPKTDQLDGPDIFGWLSPEGYFYGCTYGNHILLGMHLGRHFLGDNMDDRDLEKRKWLHISPMGFFFGLGSGHKKYEHVSQRQIDALWDWYQALKPTEKYLTAYMELKIFFAEMARAG